jgi:S-DNA-T family DNA segregation ATPase FtsK/SpoIIIE
MERYLLRLLATHLLVIGATRSGKGSVIWSLIRALAAGVRSGLVQLWVIDPKGGMEMAMGRAMYARYEDADYARMADLLDEAVRVMRDRQARLAGKVRAHTPSLAEPLIVIIIDELACLTAYLQDNELKNRIKQSLGMLLSQGTGLGVLVVGASQDPRKEVVELRDLFPTRIGLRLNEAGHVNLVLGDGARDRGALCDQIPIDPSMRGIGYVILDHQPEPARVRFSYVDDDLIRDMADTFPAPVEPTPVVAQRVRNGKAVYKPSAPLLPKGLLDALNPDAGGQA